jgi:hypothetical protein
MKTKLYQLAVYFNTIDRRYIQLAQFAFMLGMLFVTGSPDDGSSGTR